MQKTTELNRNRKKVQLATNSYYNRTATTTDMALLWSTKRREFKLKFDVMIIRVLYANPCISISHTSSVSIIFSLPSVAF